MSPGVLFPSFGFKYHFISFLSFYCFSVCRGIADSNAIIPWLYHFLLPLENGYKCSTEGGPGEENVDAGFLLICIMEPIVI